MIEAACIIALVLGYAGMMYLTYRHMDRITDAHAHALEKKDAQIAALTESLVRSEGKPFIRPPVPLHKLPPPGPRAFATKPFPPVGVAAVECAGRGD